MSQVDDVFQHENIHRILRAIGELHQNLDAAFKGQVRKQLWPANRNGIVGALVAIAWFFEKLEGFGAYANVLNELSSALADLDRGAVHAIFAAKARKGGKGKPPDNTDLMCARCRVAIALEYMRCAEASRSKRDIANEIAMKHQSLRRLRRRANSRLALSASIVSWYDDFNQGKVKNQEARDLYRTYEHVLSISKRSRSLSSAGLSRIAQQQLHLATEFMPMTKTEALGLSNFVDTKKTLKRRKGVIRDRGV